MSLIPIIKTILLSKILTLKTFKINVNKFIDSSDSKANYINKNLAKCKYIKKVLKAKIFTKAKRLKQPIFLSSKTNSVLFIKNVFN